MVFPSRLIMPPNHYVLRVLLRVDYGLQNYNRNIYITQQLHAHVHYKTQHNQSALETE